MNEPEAAVCGRKQRGFTLIELLIAMAITAILGSVVLATLKVCFDSYHLVRESLSLQKTVDEVLGEAADGSFNSQGIRDSLEIVQAGAHRIRFVLPWVDDTHLASGTSELPDHFVLNRPFKPGASIPIGEVYVNTAAGRRWQGSPVELFVDTRRAPDRPDDQVAFKKQPPSGSRVRFIYYPDSSHYPDTEMTLQFEPHQMTRIYRGRTEEIPHHREDRQMQIVEVLFQYFNNANRELEPDPATGMIPREKLNGISAVKLTVEIEKEGRRKKGSMFMNIRNSRGSGSGLLIQPGMRIAIPDSASVRSFSLGNIVGIHSGGRIEFEALSSRGQSWRLSAELGFKDNREVLRKYSIDYPIGTTVYSETVNLTTDLPLNLLALGGTGRFDYDADDGVDDHVLLEGEVELVVTRMDAAGATLYIRP